MIFTHISFIFVLIIGYINHSALAVDTVCESFRITSPVQENLQWTAGQCYQVSYDIPELKDFMIANVTVDLHNTETDEKVTNLVQEENINAFGATKPFNLELSQKESASYYYMVTLIHDGVKCVPKRSVNFDVSVNPNSPSTNRC